MLQADIAIVGAGIVGLAHALAAARRGLRVVLFEKNERAVGASIRNFGLPWPVGLALTSLYPRALRSHAIWLETAHQVGFWLRENGSLFLAYHADEEAVLHEFLDATYRDAADLAVYQWLDPDQICQINPAVRLNGLKGGLFSAHELTVDPREAIRTIPVWMEQNYGITLRFGTPVTAINPPFIETPREKWRADHIYVCSGADFETLYPNVYREYGMTRCKLQMLRLAQPAPEWKLGPTLASGLTIARYDNFSFCPTIESLRSRLKRDWPEQHSRGIHVLLAQNGFGELLVGDTHEYALTVEPFDSERFNQLILDYLSTFIALPNLAVTERWHGVYPSLNGKSELIVHPEIGVTVVQITNGLGMTMSFGLAEELIGQL